VRIFDAGVSLPDPGSFGEHRLSYRTGDILSPHVVPAEPLVVELRDFAASIADGVEPVSSAEIGLDVIRVIEAVESSLAQAGSRSAVAPSLGAGIW
jgi:predicted dehydrogenase